MSTIRTYKKKMGIFWWTDRWSHIKFISRELTSLAVAFFSIELLLLLKSIGEGPSAYEIFVRSLSHPLWMALNVIATLALFFHSITWFNLAPKAMVVKIGSTKVPGIWVTLANYAGWLVISGVIVWALFWK